MNPIDCEVITGYKISGGGGGGGGGEGGASTPSVGTALSAHLTIGFPYSS